MTHPTQTAILARSDQIVLRRLAPNDSAAFQAYRCDPDISRFQSWETMDDTEARMFLQHMAEVDPLLRPGHWTQIGITTQASDELIGDLGLFLDGTGQEAEIGITLARAYQGRGRANAAMLLAIELIFTTTDAKRIICGADQRNTASLAMIRRLPFRYTHSEKMPEGIDDMYELTQKMWLEHLAG